MLCIKLSITGTEEVVNTTVRVNNGADLVDVEGKKNFTKDGALGDLNQPSASSLIP